MHANGFAKMILDWRLKISKECENYNFLKKKNMKEPVIRYYIPEQLFEGKPTHVFRKYVVTEPWKLKNYQRE